MRKILQRMHLRIEDHSGSGRVWAGTRTREAATATKLGNDYSMLDPQHPLVHELNRHGYKLTVHAYFRDGAVSLCATAHHPVTKRTFHGRSRRGNFNEAMIDVAHSAAIELPATLG